jgi:hypothetical protein
MKWIGQHIYDQISRFRNSIYLEDISSGTIASGGNLGLDSDNKIVKQADTGITDLHGAGVDGSANQLLTDDGDGTVTSEANLTFDGTQFAATVGSSPGVQISHTASSASHYGLYVTQTAPAIGIGVNHDESGTTNAGGRGLNIDYDKSGVTGDGATCTYYGTNVSLYDTVTNHSGSTVSLIGNYASVIATNDQGTTTNYGYQALVGNADNNYCFHANAYTSGGIDYFSTGEIALYTTNSSDDYFKIVTAADGATTLTTHDQTGTAAHFEIAADGNIVLDSAAATYIESVGLTKFASAGVEIENESASENAALLIDNDDVNQIALDIDAANTTANIIDIDAGDLTTGNAIFIDANSLSTGSAINLDIDDALTGQFGQVRSLINIDYDKAGVTSNLVPSTTTGLNINLADAATNHAGSLVTMIGAQIDIDSANATGTLTQKGLILNVAADGVGDAATTSGIEMEVMDGGTDIKMMSSADPNDYCTIATGAAGATTIYTFDDSGGKAAHFEIATSGNITLDAAGQIKLEPATGSNILLDGTVTVDGGSVTGITTLGVDSVSLTAIQTSAETFANDDTSLMTSAAIDDRINTAHATVQTGKNYRIINASFRDDIGTDKHYLPLKSQDEQIVVTREEGTELAVCDGRLVSATVRVESMATSSDDFDLTIGVETNDVGDSYGDFDGTSETETLVVSTSDDHHLFHFVFDTAKHWDSTDMFAISIQSSEDHWGSNERFFVTLVIEDDWSTYLAGVSREIDTTP